MKRRIRPSRLALGLAEIAFSAAFLGMVGHHVVTQDFRPLAAFCAPILLVYYGFASLLFVRGRSLAQGPWQLRSLHAAERAMQATVWHLLGIVLGVGMYGLLRYVDAPLHREQPSQVLLRLALFAAPYGLMQAGLLSFLRAIWVIAPHLARPVTAFEVRRRVLGSAP
jgi:hypothetical protein